MFRYSHFHFLLGFVFALPSLFILSGCEDSASQASENVPSYPIRLSVTGVEEIPLNDSTIISGGYGSSIYPHPSLADHYYLLTDRGPNYDSPPVNGSESKGFSIPDYAPRIGLFKHQEDQLVLIKEILLKDAAGNSLTGLPNPPDKGGNGEVPVDGAGKILDFDPTGIDSEGLVALDDGTFWVSDEYGPYLLHLDQDGKTLERISPFSPENQRQLPKVMVKRRPNRGIEGLTVTPDQKYLVGILQSPMENPDKAARANSRICRLFMYELATGQAKEYLYVQEALKHSNNAITAISNQKFLILERDGDLAEYSSNSPHTLQKGFKRIYQIDISRATDVNDPENQINGLLVDGKTLESLSPEQIEKAGISPVRKKLAMDLLQSGMIYPHDKAEGIFYDTQNGVLGVVNDNDFGVDSDKEGRILPKRLLDGTTDFTELVLFELALEPDF